MMRQRPAAVTAAEYGTFATSTNLQVSPNTSSSTISPTRRRMSSGLPNPPIILESTTESSTDVALPPPSTTSTNTSSPSSPTVANDEIDDENNPLSDHEPDSDTTTTNRGENQNNNHDNNDENDDVEAEEDESSYRDGLTQMTRQLRCLFSAITWPIIPLGVVVTFAWLWVSYAAFWLDVQRHCSHPLHWYALASVLLFLYTPLHTRVRSYLFHYSRERDGPIRPTGVRMYDQLFHTICLLYVYGGVTLIQTCKEDVATMMTSHVIDNVMTKPDLRNDPGISPTTTTTTSFTPTTTMATATGGSATTTSLSLDPFLNSCMATCPHLYRSLAFYITCMELFTFSLILPLLFLPCIYVWFLRRAASDYETLTHFRDRLEEEEALLSNGGVTTDEILKSLEDVKLVWVNQQSSTTSHNYHSSSNGDDQGKVLLVPKIATDYTEGKDGSHLRECCICMTDFPVEHLESSMIDNYNDPVTHNNDIPASTDEKSSPSSISALVDNVFNNHDLETGLATGLSKHLLSDTTTTNTSSLSSQDDSNLVRTKCGHVFHRKCLAGWIGGRWEGTNPNNTTTTSSSTDSPAISSSSNPTPSRSNHDRHRRTGTTNSTRRSPRRARRTCCPLCRYDLRSNIGENTAAL